MSQNALIVSIIGITLILLVVVFWFISHYSDRRYRNNIKNCVNSVRSIVVDWNKQEVRFFNRTHLRNIRTVPLERYYWQFSKQDAQTINNWFIDLLKKNNKVPRVYEVEVRLHRARRYYRSLLQIVNVDYGKKIINIDSYLFLKSSRYRFKIDSEDNKNKKVVTTAKGYTASFLFTGISQAGNKENVSPLLFNQLKEVVSCMITSKHKELIHVSDNEFIILDYKMNDHNEALNDVHRYVNQMRKFLDISGKLNRVNIAVGVVYNSYYKNSFKKLVEKSRAMSVIAKDKNTLIVTYSKNMKNDSEEDKFDSEIEQVIKKKQIVYNFESIYGIKRQKVIGYIVLPTPINTSAQTMAELYSRSLRTGENKQLLQVVIKDSIAAFNSLDNRDTVLFRHLRFSEADSFLSFLRLSNKNVKQAVIFDEYDISYSSNEDKDFLNKIKRYKEKKVEICLALADKSLILDHKIYALFDYFFVYSNEKTHRRDESSNIGFRTIIEKLMKYNRPIILANVDSWSTIELFIRSGVEYVASSAIVPISDKLLEPSTKTKAKIQRMID